MSYLIFCTYEPGGWPAKMAEVLNRNGQRTYYISTSRTRGHDSAAYHFGLAEESWNVSGRLRTFRRNASLRRLMTDLRIKGCLATGIHAAILNDVGCRYCYWSYGSDLDQACFWPRMSSEPSLRRYAYYGYRVKELPYARRSIRKAEAVMIAPYQLQTLLRVEPASRTFFLPQLVRTHDWPQVVASKVAAKQKLSDRFGDGVKFFSATRHVWGRDWEGIADNKGNNVVLEAFARYKRTGGDACAKLLLVRKGPSVALTQRLASSLGVSNDIVWLEEMPRDEIQTYYYGATLCFGQFGTPVTAFTTLEPMGCGTPTVSYIGDSLDGRVAAYEEPPPLLNSRNVESIANFMGAIGMAPQTELDWGQRSWSWIAKHCSEQAFCDHFVAAMSLLQRSK